MAETSTEATTITRTGADGGPRKRTIEVRNPATGEVIASVPAIGPDGVAELVARARAAQPGWEALGFEGRGRILRRAQK